MERLKKNMLAEIKYIYLCLAKQVIYDEYGCVKEYSYSDLTKKVKDIEKDISKASDYQLCALSVEIHNILKEVEKSKVNIK